MTPKKAVVCSRTWAGHKEDPCWELKKQRKVIGLLLIYLQLYHQEIKCLIPEKSRLVPKYSIRFIPD
jgi:hypothetical protein